MTEQKPDEKHLTGGDSEHRTHSEDGVDLTLIRWMLNLTPAERLMTLQNNVRSLERLADAVREP